MQIYTYSSYGAETPLIKVETDIKKGIPLFDIIGIQDNRISEMKFKLNNIFNSNNLSLQENRILVALSPADLRKNDNHYELPIALGIIVEQNKEKYPDEKFFIAGELDSFTGKVDDKKLPVGIINAIEVAKKEGIANFIVPPNCGKFIPKGCKYIEVQSLDEAISKSKNIKNFFSVNEPSVNNEVKEPLPSSVITNSEKIASSARKSVLELKRTLNEYVNNSEDYSPETITDVLNFAMYNAIYAQDLDEIKLLCDFGANPIYSNDFELNRNIKPLMEVIKTNNPSFIKEYMKIIEDYSKNIEKSNPNISVNEQIVNAFITEYKNYDNKSVIKLAQTDEIKDILNNTFVKHFGQIKQKKFATVTFPDTNENGFFMDEKHLGNISETVKAVELAAAGKHNILITGAPECGKTSLINSLLVNITPNPTEKEKQEITRCWNLAGLVPPNKNLIENTPFRTPHQTTTIEGMAGGGHLLRPGEVTLANKGILFLDKASEFRTFALQTLKPVLINKYISISRAGRTTIFPANFQLVLTNNPSPSGILYEPNKQSLDSLSSVKQFNKKVLSILNNNLEIKTYMLPQEKPDNVSIEKIKERVATAIKIQRNRGVYNADLTPEEIKKYCEMRGKDTKALFQKLATEGGYNQQEIYNISKLALTEANMDGREYIQFQDLQEAIKLSMNEPMRKLINEFVREEGRYVDVLEDYKNININLWYKNEISDVKSLDIKFYDSDNEYRGNLVDEYGNNIGDYSTKDSSLTLIKKAFPHLTIKDNGDGVLYAIDEKFEEKHKLKAENQGKKEPEPNKPQKRKSKSKEYDGMEM